MANLSSKHIGLSIAFFKRTRRKVLSHHRQILPKYSSVLFNECTANQAWHSNAEGPVGLTHFPARRSLPRKECPAGFPEWCTLHSCTHSKGIHLSVAMIWKEILNHESTFNNTFHDGKPWRSCSTITSSICMHDRTRWRHCHRFDMVCVQIWSCYGTGLPRIYPTLWCGVNTSDIWAKWPRIGSRSSHSLGVH